MDALIETVPFDPAVHAKNSYEKGISPGLGLITVVATRDIETGTYLGSIKGRFLQAVELTHEDDQTRLERTSHPANEKIAFIDGEGSLSEILTIAKTDNVGNLLGKLNDPEAFNVATHYVDVQYHPDDIKEVISNPNKLDPINRMPQVYAAKPIPKGEQLRRHYGWTDSEMKKRLGGS